MTAHLAQVLETMLEPGPDGAVGGLLKLQRVINIQPGQYFFASSLAEDDLLATPLFPAGLPLTGGVLPVAAPLPSTWTAGTRLALRGPLGHGFALPEGVRRLALAALGNSPTRLLPLAFRALQQGTAVTLYTSTNLPGLPSALEVLPLDELPDAPAWADFLALDVPRSLLGSLKSMREQLTRHGARAQVLVTTPMPCGGSAECGACAVRTRGGWAMACKDGPVFPFTSLDLEAVLSAEVR